MDCLHRSTRPRKLLQTEEGIITGILFRTSKLLRVCVEQWSDLVIAFQHPPIKMATLPAVLLPYLQMRLNLCHPVSILVHLILDHLSLIYLQCLSARNMVISQL